MLELYRPSVVILTFNFGQDLTEGWTKYDINGTHSAVSKPWISDPTSTYTDQWSAAEELAAVNVHLGYWPMRNVTEEEEVEAWPIIFIVQLL